MKSDRLQWEEVKENYLKLIQQALAFVEHPRRTEILNNVKEHLERKYAELPPDKRTWESYQQIITEMGPPADYATLLCDDIIRTGQSRTGLYTLLGGLFVIILLAVGAYLMMRTNTGQPQTAQPQTPLFELDPNVLGKWVSVDFVDTIEIFNPAQKSWKNELYLQSLDFKKQGLVEWCLDKNQQKTVRSWTKGMLDPNDTRPSPYAIKLIGGNAYLFVGWISGDVTIREEKPYYYVLTQDPQKVPFNIAASATKETPAQAPKPLSEKPVEPQQPIEPQTPLASEPAILGKWIAVDYVRKMDDFVPTLRQWQKTLILKELQFIAPATVYWSFNNNIVKQTSFTETTAETINGQSAQYTIKTIEGQEYLFIEWVTQGVAQQEQVPWYYVLRKEALDSAAQAAGQPSADKSDVLGRWASVDFVKTIEEFDPGRKSWSGSFYLTGLDFQNNNQVWFSFSSNNRFQHSWMPGKVETGESRPALYTIKNFDGSLYMFFEWISGDVTIRGQKPWYYVLKKAGAPAASVGRTANRKMIVGANYCTMNFVESQIGQAASKEAKMLRYPAQGVDFCFSNQGVLSEVHYNQGYQGQLQNGISLTSTAEDVFRAYGKPSKTIQTDSLSQKNDEGILYQNGSTSRIYYGKHGLIFWFRDNVVSQIIVFEGEIPLIANTGKKPVSEMPSIAKNVFVVSFRPKSFAGILTSRELLDAFNRNHPQGVRTYRYRAQIQNNQLTGYICTDNQAGAEAIREMLAKSDSLEFLNVTDATPAEYEAYCQLKQVDLPSSPPGPEQEKSADGSVVDSNPMNPADNSSVDANQNRPITLQANPINIPGKITFIRYGHLKQVDCVEQINLASGEIRRLVQANSERSSIRSFCFSPDKKQFLFEMGSGENWYENNEIYCANSSDGSIRWATDNRIYDGDPAWSLDGERIAFTRGWGAGCVYLRDLESGQEHPLSIPELVISRQPQWLTEGSLLIVGFDTENRQGLVDFDIKTGNARWLLKDQVDYLCLSPDKKKLACVVQKMNETPHIIQQMMKENDWLYSVNILTLATTQLKPLNDRQTVFENDACPLWSHDGQKLAWIRNNFQKNRFSLLVYDTNKESTLAIPLPDEKAVSLVWAPDDSRIAYVSCNQKETNYHLRIFLLSAGTSDDVFSSENRIQCCHWD